MSNATVISRGDLQSIASDKGGGRRAGDPAGVGTIRGWEWGAIGGILVLALVLRIVGLNAPLWYDEVLTLTEFVRQPWGSLVQDFSSLNNHMFYSLQAKAVLAVTGETAWALRAPSLVFGMGSLVVLWLVGREAAGRNAALIATLLTAISYHHIWFTQNARGYTGLLFWTALATLLLVQNLRKPSWKLAAAYAACVAAGMYTHLSAAFFFAAHGLVYVAAIVIDRSAPGRMAGYPGLRDIRPFAAFALGGLVTLLLHLPIIPQVFKAVNEVSSGADTGSMSEWENPFRTLQEVVGSLGALGPVAPIAFAGGVALILIGAASILRRSPMLAAIYILQIPVTLAFLLALSFRIWPRYFFVDIGFVFISVAAGILVVSGWMAPLLRRVSPSKALMAAPAAAAVIVATGASAMLLPKNYDEPKQDFVGAVSTMKAAMGPEDIAVSSGLAALPVQSYFAPDWPVVDSAADLEALERPGRTIWVMTAFDSTIERTNPDVAARLERDFELVEKRTGTLGGGSIRIYRSRAKGV